MAKISTAACFVNKISLEHSHTHWLTCRLQLLKWYAGRAQQLQQEPSGLQSLKYFLSNPLQKLFVNPFLKALNEHLICYFLHFSNETNGTPIKNQLTSIYWTPWSMLTTLKEVIIVVTKQTDMEELESQRAWQHWKRMLEWRG